MNELSFKQWFEKYHDEDSMLTAELQYDAYTDRIEEEAQEQFKDEGL